MAATFEFVSRLQNCGNPLPSRATSQSAGYDLYVAEAITVPSYSKLMNALRQVSGAGSFSLEQVADFTKNFKIRPTLVSTGVKCKLDEGTFLQLNVRSSTPLKHWLVLANGSGIIDADYYNNPENEGEIYLQFINLSPFDIRLQVGDKIGQGIILPYLTISDDAASGARVGGLGSTT